MRYYRPRHISTGLYVFLKKQENYPAESIKFIEAKERAKWLTKRKICDYRMIGVFLRRVENTVQKKSSA
jgi:hypothetical protein